MQTQNQHLLFTGELKYQKYRDIIWKVLSICIAIYCSFYFSENPVVIGIIVLFLLYVFILPGHEIMHVYEDLIEFKVQNPIIPFFTKSRQFKFDEIVSIDSNLQFGKKEQFLSDLTNSSMMRLSYWNTLKFTFKSGKQTTISSKIYKADILKAFEIIQKQTQNSILFT
jgi:hypothetical protein